MEVTINGIVYIPKDNKAELEIIKQKEWYENNDNFPCIVIQVNYVDSYAIDCGYLIFRDINDYDRFGGDYRFPTKEEVLSLLIKEG